MMKLPNHRKFLALGKELRKGEITVNRYRMEEVKRQWAAQQGT